MNVDLTFTAPTNPVSENAVRGKHWAVVKGHTDPWKDAAWVTALNARWSAVKAAAVRRSNGYGARPITVQVVIPFRTARRRDPHNYVGTVVKAVVDGLVRARVVPDDTAEWVTVLEPELTVVTDRTQPLTATIRIRPRNEA